MDEVTKDVEKAEIKLKKLTTLEDYGHTDEKSIALMNRLTSLILGNALKEHEATVERMKTDNICIPEGTKPCSFNVILSPSQFKDVFAMQARGLLELLVGSGEEGTSVQVINITPAGLAHLEKYPLEEKTVEPKASDNDAKCSD